MAIDDRPGSPAEQTETERARRWLDRRAQLAFASFLMLFAELALIRWTAANNVYVTNATNFVLLASFLGIGIGFLNAKSSRDFVLSTVVMAGFGQVVARLFVAFRPLRAYRLDIGGSVAGIAVFTLLSFLELPPVAWGVIAAGGLVLLMGRSARWWQYAAAVIVVVMLAIESAAPHEQWSPYYKISAEVSGKAHPALYVSANNIPTRRPAH